MVGSTYIFVRVIWLRKLIILTMVIVVLFSLTCVSAKDFVSPQITVNSDNVFIVYEPNNPENLDYLYCQSYNHYGSQIMQESMISEINFTNTAQFWIDYDICAVQNGFLIVNPKPIAPGDVNIFCSRFSNGEKKFDVQISKNHNDESWSPKVACDQNGDLYVFYWSLLKEHGIFFSKVDSKGDILINTKEIINDGKRRFYPIDVKLSSGTLYLHFSTDHSQNLLLEIDTNGTILSNETLISEVAIIPNHPIITDDNNNLLYLDDNGIVDSRNNLHIITSASNSCAAESASLLYTKLNRTGTKLIENLTIATHEKKKDCEHGPSIFDPKVAIDSEDNIHVTWYINDGNNRFSIWYEKIDANGTVLIPAMKIAPEDEADEDEEATPGFGAEAVVGIVVLMMVFWLDRKRKTK